MTNNVLHGIDLTRESIFNAYFKGFSNGYIKALKDDSYSYYLRHEEEYIKSRFYEHLTELSTKE